MIGTIRPDGIQTQNIMSYLEELLVKLREKEKEAKQARHNKLAASIDMRANALHDLIHSLYSTMGGND